MSDKKDIEFVDGLIVKAPRQQAPEYVKASLSIRREALIAWLQGRDGEWINLDVKESQSGKWYAAVDNWKPNQGSGSRGGAPQRSAPVDDFEDSDIPF